MKKYHLFPDKSQKTLATGSDEAKEKADATNKSLGQKLKEEKKAKGKDKEKPAEEPAPPDDTETFCGKDQIIMSQQIHSPTEIIQAIETIEACYANLNKRLTLEGKAQQDQNLWLFNIEKEIKDQREDYHSQIRQLVNENETAHKNFSAELSQVAADTNKALVALKQTNDVAREASNRQATVITKLHNQVREQGDDILELKKRILAIEEKKAGRPRKARA